MAKITKVPNGPLIKKKGTFKGSTLKKGGVIKKAQEGVAVKKTWQQMSQPEKAAKMSSLKTPEAKRSFRDSISAAGEKQRQETFARGAAIRGISVDEYRNKLNKDAKKSDVQLEGLRGMGKETTGCSGSERNNARRLKAESRRKNGGKITKLKK